MNNNNLENNATVAEVVNKKFYIHEENIERLEKKLRTIQRKCNKYGAEFHYARVGEEFIENEETKEINHYIIVEASGLVKHSDWTFIAVNDHREGFGNVIRAYVQDIEIPERFYHTDASLCEHCNTRRRRKDTYIIHNEATDEWKQVGKSCLKEFTDGLDAEEVARYMQWFEVLEGGFGYSGPTKRKWYKVEDLLLYATECVKHFGYQKSEEYRRTTKERVWDYYLLVEEGRAFTFEESRVLKEEMDEVNFVARTEENVKAVEEMLNWIRNQEDSISIGDSYMQNLLTICKDAYCTARDSGILVSLVPTYRRYLKKLADDQKREEVNNAEAKTSNHVGQVGDKLDIAVDAWTCVYRRDSIYGVQFLYKFIDIDGNVLMWSTGNFIDDEAKIKSIKGTVKSHEEYNGVKQTFITRCRITYNECK